MPNLDAIRQAVRVLNEALAADPDAIEELFGHRVQVNEVLADHPTIQVTGSIGEPPTMNVLGLINGLFGVDDRDWGFIASEHDNEKGRIERFVVLPDEPPEPPSEDASNP